MRIKVVQTQMKIVSDKAIRDRVEKVMKESAEEIAVVAAGLAPKLTGDLAKSIKPVKLDDAHWRVFVGEPYGMYPEFGTVHQAAQPYLRPAVDAEKSRIRRRLGQIRKGLADELGLSTRIQKVDVPKV